MSDVNIYLPSVSTRACVRSFALASEAPRITPKEEVLILSRLMSATLGYNSIFWNYLKAAPDSPLHECDRMARRSKRSAFLERSSISTGDHEDFVAEAKSLYQKLGEYVVEFDQKRGVKSGIQDVIEVGRSFISAQESARTKSMENGLPAIHYVNPYVVVNAASLMLFDILKDLEFGQRHRTPHDLQQSIRPLYNFVDRIRSDYPVQLTPNTDGSAHKNDQVRDALIGIHSSLEDHIRNVPEVDIEIKRAAHYGMATIRDYISPFVCNIAPERKAVNATILTFTEWKPKVAAAKERKAQRDERRKLHPELFTPDFDI